jgi:hypothetical protein
MRTRFNPFMLLGTLTVLALLATPALSEQQAGAAAAKPEGSPAPSGAVATEPEAPAAESGAADASPAADAAVEPEGATAQAEPEAKGYSPTEDYHSWLEQVRAQRKAYAESREAARRSYYPAPPWSDEMDKQRDAYADAMRERVERQREARRNYRRWVNPRAEYLRDLQEQRRDAREAQLKARREYVDQLRHQQAELWDTNPYGWNNPWYYRGY